MSFSRYPAYIDSGVDWLGKIPSHWTVDRMKHAILGVKNGIWGDDAQGNDEDIPCVRVADFDRVRLRVSLDDPTIRNVTRREQSGRLLHQGDLLLEKSGGGETQPVGCVVLYDDPRTAVCSNFVARVELRTDMDPSFWRYAHAAAYAFRVNVKSIKQTSGIQNLDAHSYFDEPGPFPPLEEQRAIAAFLDRETAKIDALVAEQRRLTELLKEKRQAVISHAVTKGLNPTAPMKASGVDWLGDVPAHWSVESVRRFVDRMEQGWSPECHSRAAEGDEWGVVKSGCVNRGVFNESENKALPEELHPMSDLEIRRGDVLVSRASGSPELVGSTAFIEQTRPRLMLSDKIFRVHLSRRVDPQFFALMFNSQGMRLQIERAISGADGLANNLPQSSLYTFQCALPPLVEQREIVWRVAEETERCDQLFSDAQRAITLLLERRSVLVSAAVTGQIDVRSLAPAEAA